MDRTISPRRRKFQVRLALAIALSMMTSEALSQTAPINLGELVVLRSPRDPSVSTGLEKATFDPLKATVCYYGLDPLAAHPLLVKSFADWSKISKFKKPVEDMYSGDDLFTNLRDGTCLAVAEVGWVRNRVSRINNRDSNVRILAQSVSTRANVKFDEYELNRRKLTADKENLLRRMAEPDTNLNFAITTNALNSDVMRRVCVLKDSPIDAHLSWLRGKIITSIDLADNSNFTFTQPTGPDENFYPIVYRFLRSPVILVVPDVDAMYRSLTAGHQSGVSSGCATAILPSRLYTAVINGLRRAEIAFSAPIRSPYVFSNAEAAEVANDEAELRKRAAEARAAEARARAEAQSTQRSEVQKSEKATKVMGSLDIPRLNIQTLCGESASCVKRNQEHYDDLKNKWGTFSDKNKSGCLEVMLSVSDYTALLDCMLTGVSIEKYFDKIEQDKKNVPSFKY